MAGSASKALGSAEPSALKSLPSCHALTLRDSWEDHAPEVSESEPVRRPDDRLPNPDSPAWNESPKNAAFKPVGAAPSGENTAPEPLPPKEVPDYLMPTYSAILEEWKKSKVKANGRSRVAKLSLDFLDSMDIDDDDRLALKRIVALAQAETEPGEGDHDHDGEYAVPSLVPEHSDSEMLDEKMDETDTTKKGITFDKHYHAFLSCIMFDHMNIIYHVVLASIHGPLPHLAAVLFLACE